MSEPVRPIPFPRDVAVPLEQPELPPSPGEQAQARMNETAERVGYAVGKASATIWDLPRRLQYLKQRFIVIRGRTREDAAAAAAGWRQTAAQRAAQTRTRAQQLAHDYPLHAILGCAAAAFVIGFALRIWRSNNAK
ncbi:MAG: hypothetical protein ACE14M_14545 [Terriglobales bacterium]